MRAFSLHWMGTTVTALTVSLAGCQTTRLWPQAPNTRGSKEDVAIKGAETSVASTDDVGTAASLRTASAMIDQAAKSPETEPKSYNAGSGDLASPSSAATCTSGCCR